MKKHTALASALLLSLFISGAADAADGYVTDAGGAVVRSGQGLCWKTGYWTPAAASAECDPELAAKPKPAEKPLAQAGSPAPAPMPAPAKATSENVTLAADTLFAPGTAKLTRQGKARLDELAATLQGRRVERVAVVAHTDRAGAKQANQRLSQKRAAAVKAYLVAKKVDAGLISVEGKGGAEPVTAQDDCRGRKGRKLTACLAPDRRVEIGIARLD